ncbi:MAG: hypothetical protein E2598_02655 [Sphingobium sp.]|nr:hypothetical protein [Sphingobium sp.]
MVSLKSIAASGRLTQDVLLQISDKIEENPINPDMICVFYDYRHQDQPIYDFIRTRFPDAAILGGTSCGGVMNEDGLTGPWSIGLLLIEDPDGDYGTAAALLGEDVASSAEKVLHAALEDADCAGELPELIWIYQAPGQEEAVIEGLRRVVGERCPIIGGSSADDDVEGHWRQMGPDGLMRDGLVVGVMFSSGGIGFAFQGGYEPVGPTGIVTKIAYGAGGSSGVVTTARGREIISIDGQPAAEVYNRWMGGLLSDKLAEGGGILTDTTMYPLGIDAGHIEGVAHYILIHPDRIMPNGALSTFASVEEGAQLYSMRGDKARLVERAGKVATAAAATLPGGADNLAGGLVVYCAGCRLAVGDQMPQVATAVSTSFGGRPFIGCFTFGEQGYLLDKNAHGNLMISAIAFGR